MAIGDIIPIPNSLGKKVRRTVIIEDTEYFILLAFLINFKFESLVGNYLIRLQSCKVLIFFSISGVLGSNVPSGTNGRKCSISMLQMMLSVRSPLSCNLQK